MKTAAVLRAPDISITGSDGDLCVSVLDLKNPTSNSYDMTLGKTDKTFTANLRVENMKLVNTDYKVFISSKKISKFLSVDESVQFYIALEGTSEF
jgi:hypothetical protein